MPTIHQRNSICQKCKNRLVYNYGNWEIPRDLCIHCVFDKDAAYDDRSELRSFYISSCTHYQEKES